jgi:hypothetical protein
MHHDRTTTGMKIVFSITGKKSTMDGASIKMTDCKYPSTTARWRDDARLHAAYGRDSHLLARWTGC